MDLNVARERLTSVVTSDSITASRGDFLATHIPVKRLQLLSRFEVCPDAGEEYSEEQVFRKIILNPQNKHQVVAVYGQSGTGKSHTIRWFEARFEREKPENEVVLFIRRSDNTLKGTIRQLLEKPEVQGIANREVYERLIKASVCVDENELKDLIYHNFLVKIENDDDSREVKITRVKRRRLKAFLNNEIIQERMMSPEGPIERIYSKIAENTLVDRDTVAEFVKDDFTVSADLCEDMQRTGADSMAIKMARALMADESGSEEAEKLARYLNQFVSEVIQRCAGIEPGDFGEIFKDIRRELYRLGKNLTLFIEDITSFTGVDEALLDALMLSHTGMNEVDGICRLSSVVGTTIGYLQNNFKDNHKERITQYVYLPDDLFDETGLFEFIGRYLNTMSLPEEKIAAWLDENAAPELYPVHEVKEGKQWEYIHDSSDKDLCLFPFTKNSIRYYYRYALGNGHRTPRYIIRNIIEPVVRDALNGVKNFPSRKETIINLNTKLSYMVNNQVADKDQADRLLRFASIWGDGSTDQFTKDGKTYIAAIPQEIYEELGLPLLQLNAVSAPVQQAKEKAGVQSEKHAIVEHTEKKSTDILDAKQQKISEATTALTEWANGKPIDISSNVGVSRLIKAAREDLCAYLYSAINWQAEGISIDNAEKSCPKSDRLVSLENQLRLKNPGYYELPANLNSVNILCAFIKWREFGSKSWNYPESDFDVYLVSSWVRSVKADVVKAMDDHNNSTKTSYIEAAITAEMYRLIINGEYREKSLKNLTVSDLFSEKAAIKADNGHSKKWNELIGFLGQGGMDADNRRTIRQYFNITQGEGSKIVVLNEPGLSQAFRKVKGTKLDVPEEILLTDDPVKQRNDVFKYMRDIITRAETAAKSEVEDARADILPIYDYFDSEEIDEEDILELTSKAKVFYDEAEKTMINSIVGGTPLKMLEQVKKSAIQIAKALMNIGSVLDEENIVTILMTFSSDPRGTIQPLLALLQKLDEDIGKVEKAVRTRTEKLTGTDGDDYGENKYGADLQMIASDADLVQGLR